MKAIHLQTENLFEPIGLDIENPRFFWHAEGGTKQTAYQIIVTRDGQNIWDSGKVTSDRMTGIRYGGETLKSRDELIWAVTLWDEHDEQGEAAVSSFEMGLLEPSDWQGKWIKGNYKVNPKKRYPVDHFKKDFTVTDVKKARLYASAKGVYDVVINGKRLEDFILAPGITDYRKRIQYQTYDITAFLSDGKNSVEFRLADGWYRGSSAAYGVTNVYGTETALIGQLEIETTDGKQIIATDDSFAWSNDGPIEFADLKDGEIIDNNKMPSYSGRAVLAKQDGNLVSGNNVYVKEHETFSARLVKREVNKYVFDFGQNIAGYITFDLHAQKGDSLTVTCAEVLDENRDINMKGIQLPRPAKGWNQMALVMTLLGKEPKKDIVMTPLQQVRFTCRDARNTYKTSFAVFGFRYIEVISDFPVKAEQFKAVAVYSDMEETGTFESSNELINQFVSNVRWSMKSNFLDIPTDCPTRERLGWTGDAQIFFNSGSYLMDTVAFFNKWLIDMEDAQYKNGVLPAVLPYEGVEMMYKATGTSVGWADAVYMIPYRFYKKYNDPDVLRKFWPMIQKYADYLFANLGFSDKKTAKADPEANRYVYEKGVHLGEWLEPEEFRDKVYGAKAKHPEECTAYLYYSMKTIGEIAELLGEKNYADKCERTAQGARNVYNKLFVESETIETRRQAKLVRPLALGLLEGTTKRNVENRLKKAIEDYDYCVGTGFLSTPFVLPVLEEAGFTDTAYQVLLNEKAPGWLSEVKQGATTIWENWEGDLSQNHYSPGAAVEWLFSSVLGINVEPGNQIVLKPCFTTKLDHAEGCYKSIYGMIRAAWKKTEKGFIYECTVPVNTKTTLVLGGEEKQFEPGTYRFEI